MSYHHDYIDAFRTPGGIVLSESEERHDARTGRESSVTYTGTRYECEVKRDYLKAQGASILVIRPTGTGWWTLHAEFPWGSDGWESDEIPSIHEIEIMELAPDLLLEPHTRNFISSDYDTADACAWLIKRVFADLNADKYESETNVTRAEQVAAARADLIDQAGEATLGARCAKVLGLLLRGAEATRTYSSVYKRTLTAATLDQIDISWEGVQKIWTTDELIAFEGVPQAIAISLPDDSKWLKSRPQVIAASGQKNQLIYHYTECHLASAIQYDAFGAAVLLDAE